MLVSARAQLQFTDLINLENTPVKSQDITGTCWSYSTASFMESEALRLNEQVFDLSEMFVVRYIYLDKARNYILRQGKANFSEGGLAHDFMRAMHHHGIVPQSAYDGRPLRETQYDHRELAAVLKHYLDGVLAAQKPSPYWQRGFEAILDAYLGPVPEHFEYKGRRYTPASFAKAVRFDAHQYIELTSFTHHPFNTYFVLEIPDNFSNGLYYNIPLDLLQKQVDYALEHGYTVSWDGDVSEPGFDSKHGIAVLTATKTSKEENLEPPIDELPAGQAKRQEWFENWTTTDDHLMHITGKARDQKGNLYYIVKNSWGTRAGVQGYYYMSERYFLMKTIAIMVHRDALLPEIHPEPFLPVVLD